MNVIFFCNDKDGKGKGKPNSMADIGLSIIPPWLFPKFVFTFFIEEERARESPRLGVRVTAPTIVERGERERDRENKREDVHNLYVLLFPFKVDFGIR